MLLFFLFLFLNCHCRVNDSIGFLLDNAERTGFFFKSPIITLTLGYGRKEQSLLRTTNQGLRLLLPALWSARLP